MAIYLGDTEIGGIVDLTEDVDPELTEQEEELAGLEAEVNALEDKPQSDIQYMIDQTNSCQYLFYKYTGTDLSFIKNLDTSRVTNMRDMFSECLQLTSLDISNLDTSNVTTMYNMFWDCIKLQTLDLSNFNTSNVTTMYNMFYDCKNLTSINLSNFDFNKVTAMNQVFRGCNKLKTIIGNINLYSAPNTDSIFLNCSVLEDVTLLNIKKSLRIGSGTSYGTNLTNATLINTLQQLWDLTGVTSQTLYLSTTSKENIANIYVKLVDVTDEMLAQDQYAANKKPCVVCEPTDEGAMTLTEYATSKNWAIA